MTRHAHPLIGLYPSHPRARRCLHFGVILGCIAMGLSACGGGSSSAPNSSPPEVPVADLGRGDVTVRVTSESGTPIKGAEVDLNGNFDGRTAKTAVDGRVRFSNVPAGEATISAFARGFVLAGLPFVVERDEKTELSVALVRAAKATPVVLATHAVPSEDALKLTVDVDLAVLGEDGLAISTLVATDFSARSSDCAFMWCVMDAQGAPLLSGGYSAHVDAARFGWHDAPSGPPSASATALLLEQSAPLSGFDPEKRHLAAVNAFLGLLTAPDSVLLASYGGPSQSEVLTTYGPFTSDGALFHDAVEALSSDDGALNPLYAGLDGMLSWTATQAIGGTAGHKTIVLVSGGWSWPDDDCAANWTCPHASRVAIAEKSRALGIPVVAIGGKEPAADIAARTGGSSVMISDPEQYAVVLGNLQAIVMRRVGFNRVRLVLDAGAVYGSQAERTFESGNTVWTYVGVRVASGSNLLIPVVIPIP